MNYEPVFFSVGDDWISRWRLLREFIRRWHNIELGEVGYQSELAESEEKKLGFNLPPSFKQWISLASELTDKGRFDVFRDTYEVTNLESISATTLLLQGEGDYYWAVKNEYLHLDDPPVEGYWLDYRLTPERFVWFARDSEHITSFVLGHLAFYLHGAGGGCSVDVTADTNFLDEMKQSFDVHSTFDHLSIFEKPNLIAMVIPDPAEKRHTLLVEIWKTISYREIPECIIQLIGGGGSFHGMLLPK